MRILFVIDTLGQGGQERQLIELLKGLDRHKDITYCLVLWSKNIHYDHSFPMDLAMIEGSAPLAGVRHEKGLWVERLEKSGQMKDCVVADAPMAPRVLYYVLGYAAVAAGVLLLIGGLVNAPHITW